jgi:regulatory protein
MLGECGTKRAMNRQRSGRNHRPLDAERLEELALRYAGRYATTRAKLVRYLQRKLRERGWSGDEPPQLDAVAARFAQLGYVDDRAYALAKEASHSARGLGRRRLSAALRSDGVEEEQARDALELAASKSLESALRLAERRRLGPYATSSPGSPREREKAIATLIRGGHAFDMARSIVDLSPGDEAGLAGLRERFGETSE